MATNNNSNTTSNKQVTPMEILLHRKNRKESGMVGCITGKPEPDINFYGFSDVQIWNVDASGRFICDGGNRKDPGCFCFDCRDAFDPKGEIDAEIVNEGHERACWVYASLLGPSVAAEPESNTPPPRCDDCGEKDASGPFHHLDGRSFDLCEDCYEAADHDDLYLAHVKFPNLRVGSWTAAVWEATGFSNDVSVLKEAMNERQQRLPTRSNGGGIQKV